ncbi:g9338 [Coccomyxa elongata]
MTVESKQAFYKEITTYLGAKDEAQMASILKAATRNTVTAFNEKCYVMFPENLACIHPHLNSQSCAKLYQGWTIDSKSNPTAVAAIFRKQTGKTSSCSGALISSSHIDQNGLKPLLTCQEFVDAPEPEKWGREQEIAQVKSVESHQTARMRRGATTAVTFLQRRAVEEISEESSEESAEKSGNKRAAAQAIPDKRGNSVKQTPGGGKKRSTEEINGTSRGADAAGKSTKRAKKSSATPPAGEKSIATPPAGEKAKNLIDPAEFDSIIAAVRNQLFNDSVPKEEYIKLQQENARLATECKRAQDLAASRQAALEEYTSLLSRMNAVTKPK